MEQVGHCQEESGGGNAVRCYLPLPDGEMGRGTWTGAGLCQYRAYLSEKPIICVREDIVHLFQGTQVVHVYRIFFNGIS